MNFYSASGEILPPSNPKTKKVSMVLEKSFLRRKFGKPEVTESSYTDSEWIFAAIQLISNSTAKVPVRLYRQERNGNKSEVLEHRALAVLKKPNASQTTNDLRAFTQMNEELFGQAYWHLGRGGWTGMPKEIYPLKGSEVQPRLNQAGDLIGYSVGRWGVRVDVPVEEIIAFRQVSPNAIHEGESAAKACVRSVKADVNTLKYVESFFENSARPDFIISVLGIDPDQAEELEKRWENKHGGVNNSNKPSVIDGEMNIEKMSSALKDLDITDQSKERRDRILAAFGVPKAVLGMVDDVNRSSMDGSKIVFSEFVVDPRLQEYVEKLNTFYLPLFPNTENLFFEADEHIPRDTELLLKEVESGLNSGYMTINEAREARGYDPIKGGDELLVSFGRAPISQILNPEPKPQEKPKKEDDKKEFKKAQSLVESENEFNKVHTRNERKFAGMVEDLFERQKRDVLNGLKKGFSKDSMNPLDEQRWLREFIEISIPLYVLMVEDGGELGASSVSALTNQVAEFTPRSTAVINEVSRMANKFANFVNETTKDNLRESLMEGLGAGESEAAMADRVDEVFKKRKNNAPTIARTETTRAVNFGQLESYKQNGIKRKQWISSNDEDSRPEHLAANLQVREISDPFDVGGESLQVPGDPSGSLQNTINCRCRPVPAL